MTACLVVNGDIFQMPATNLTLFELLSYKRTEILCSFFSVFSIYHNSNIHTDTQKPKRVHYSCFFRKRNYNEFPITLEVSVHVLRNCVICK